MFLNLFQCRTVKMKEVSSGKETVIYNAKEAISGLKAPVLTDPKVTSFYFSISKSFSLNFMYSSVLKEMISACVWNFGSFYGI